MLTPLPGATRLTGALALLLLAGCAKEAAAPSAPDTPSATSSNASAVPGTMMQGFYWDVPQSTSGQTWWQVLGGQAAELSAAGITAMWLPPAYKGAAGGYDDGYGVYDRYDLGEFNQKGSVATRYGTLAQLQSCVSALHGKGIQVYEDMVMNHFMGADAQESFTYNGTNYNVWTSFTYPARANKYSTYQWHYYNFNGAQQAPNNGWYQWNPWDFQPYNNGDAYDNLMGCEVRYADVNQVNETVKWGNWMTTTLGLDGYRIDAGKHMLTSFLNTWFDQVKGSRFAVSEVWFNSVSELNSYASATGGRTSLFDVPLHYTFKAMSDGNGSWDMRGLEFAGFTESNGPLSVSFVDNHDTDNQGGLYSPIVNLKMLAYAYILMREKGYPCVFYKDYYNYGLGAQIKTLNLIRQAHAYGSGYEYTSADDADVYAYSRAGDASHTGLLTLLNDGSSNATKTLTTPFKNATLTDLTGNTAGTVTTDANGTGTFAVNSRSYAVWVPQPTTAVTFNINYSNTVSGQNLYIVGSTGQLGSWNTANAIQLSGAAFPNWSVTLPLTAGIGVQYKYFRKDGSGNILWENDPNNSLTPAGTTQTVTDTWH
ncbi:alpha-amylase domain-containing protein [Hymenobacter baengnokdamensis]|uniref:alpha-amylase domain-containing protein n=1 Tax=Hymenobacter baengnokdamensis TaxID=2615203 RepID=UPI00178430D8|nr:alpha-amylase domain-containing protein [Hymenobacter baengnokdamensis]